MQRMPRATALVQKLNPTRTVIHGNERLICPVTCSSPRVAVLLPGYYPTAASKLRQWYKLASQVLTHKAYSEGSWKE